MSQQTSSSVVFGINFGNGQASLAAFKNGRAEVVADEAGEREMPMLVTHLHSEKLVGHSAKQALHRNSRSTCIAMPTLLQADLSSPDIKTILDGLPCKVTVQDGVVGYQLENDMGSQFVTVGSALVDVFTKLADTAKMVDSSTQMPAVLAVPSTYNNDQKYSIKQCAQKAGFKVLSVLSQPSLSILPYNLCQDEVNGHVLVFDLGMSTLTLTVLCVRSGLVRTIHSQCFPGLGGTQLDAAVVTLLLQEYQRQSRKDISDNSRALFKLKAAAQTAKHSLSNQQTAAVHIESLHEGMDFQCTIARGRFEGVCQPVFQSYLDPVHQVLSTAGVTSTVIEKVVLAGGGCRVPRLREMLSKVFPNSELLGSVPADHVVTLGAAMQAALMEEYNAKLPPSLPSSLPCTSQDIYVVCSGSTDCVSHLLIAHHSPLPCVGKATVCCKRPEGSGDVQVNLSEGDTVNRRVVAQWDCWVTEMATNTEDMTINARDAAESTGASSTAIELIVGDQDFELAAKRQRTSLESTHGIVGNQLEKTRKRKLLAPQFRQIASIPDEAGEIGEVISEISESSPVAVKDVDVQVMLPLASSGEQCMGQNVVSKIAVPCDESSIQLTELCLEVELVWNSNQGQSDVNLTVTEVTSGWTKNIHLPCEIGSLLQTK